MRCGCWASIVATWYGVSAAGGHVFSDLQVHMCAPVSWQNEAVWSHGTASFRGPDVDDNLLVATARPTISSCGSSAVCPTLKAPFMWKAPLDMLRQNRRTSITTCVQAYPPRTTDTALTDELLTCAGVVPTPTSVIGGRHGEHRSPETYVASPMSRKHAAHEQLHRTASTGAAGAWCGPLSQHGPRRRNEARGHSCTAESTPTPVLVCSQDTNASSPMHPVCDACPSTVYRRKELHHEQGEASRAAYERARSAAAGVRGEGAICGHHCPGQ